MTALNLVSSLFIFVAVGLQLSTSNAKNQDDNELEEIRQAIQRQANITDRQEDFIQEQARTIAELTKIIDHQATVIDQLQSNISIIRESIKTGNSTAIGFSAYASGDRDYDQGTTIQFDQIVTNVGGFYDSSLGFFTCPINGLYQFSTSIFTLNNYQMYASIIKEDATLLGIFSTLEYYSQGTTTVFTECMAFEKVWVECSGYNYRVAGGRESSFSGALVVAL